MLDTTVLELRQDVSVVAVWHTLHPQTWHSRSTLVLCLGAVHQAQRPASLLF